MSDDKLINYDNNNVVIIKIVINVNVIIILYKMFIKRVKEIIKRKRRNYDIYNNLKVYIITKTLFIN